MLKNKILPFGIAAIVARVYKGESWFDRKECIVLDYSQTSLVAGWIRDEIRMIEPSFYLGRGVRRQNPHVSFRAAVLTPQRTEAMPSRAALAGQSAIIDDRPSRLRRALAG